MKKTVITILLLALIILSLSAQNVIVVIIDGARYTETFGDAQRRFIPYMDSLSQYGTIIDKYYNRHKTYTSQAIPALWTGSWAGTRDTVLNGQSTQYTLRPSVFEYYRKQRTAPLDSCIYTLQYVPSLWRQSFYPGYGPDYWPMTVSEGASDIEVQQLTKQIVQQYHPRFLWMYLADVDHAGHSGDWNTYTRAIEIADSLVADLWNFVQEDDFYRDKTYLLVTNDHGRHDDQHGGFQWHGCSCEGCQHIMFLALGPDIKQNYISQQEYETQDFAVTVAHILGVNPEYADGQVIDDIFTSSTSGIGALNTNQGSLKYLNKRIIFSPPMPGNYQLSVYSVSGRRIFFKAFYLKDNKLEQNLPLVSEGIYFLTIAGESNYMINRKIVVY